MALISAPSIFKEPFEPSRSILLWITWLVDASCAEEALPNTQNMISIEVIKRLKAL
jgi:hypothetical protein